MAHQHYKGTGQMHSFRGLLADGEQAKIRIEGATGEIAWRINKFQVITESPADSAPESIIQIWREEQTSVSAKINFSDAELLAAAFYSQDATAANIVSEVIIFDNGLFARNIYITHIDDNTGQTNSCNYYIELEEVKISAAGMAQLAVAAARRT